MKFLSFMLDANTQQILLIVGMVVLLGGFMFYSTYRNKKKNAQMTEMASKLNVGDKVQTIGGIVGIISEVDRVEGTITISTGTSTVVFNKQAVYAFGFFDKQKPAEKQGSQQENTEEIIQSSENMDAINADFIDAQVDKPNTAKKSKKSKKSAEDTARFE